MMRVIKTVNNLYISNHTLFSENQLVVEYNYDSWSANAKS